MKIDLRVVKDYVSSNIELFIVPMFFLVFILLIQYLWSYFHLPGQADLINNIQTLEWFMSLDYWGRNE
jgi:hypothetical protein